MGKNITLSSDLLLLVSYFLFGIIKLETRTLESRLYFDQEWRSTGQENMNIHFLLEAVCACHVHSNVFVVNNILFFFFFKSYFISFYNALFTI